MGVGVMDSYKTIQKAACAELVFKRSRFIGQVMPATTPQQAMEELAAIRKTHYDASHNIYAFSLRQPALFKFSDDGEPHGTAGLPVLTVLQKEQFTDCVLVVTRYFGGTLLGAGGLVRAYSACAKAALDAAGSCTRVRCFWCEVQCEYSLYGKVTALITGAGGKIIQAEHAAQVTLHFVLPVGLYPQFHSDFTDLTFGKIPLRQIKTDFFAGA